MTENEKYLEWKEFVRDEELASDLASVEGNEEEIFERFYHTRWKQRLDVLKSV